jgi:glyoxylase-like metal-dependent hydrolase (beta-lactamase superfamily II)
MTSLIAETPRVVIRRVVVSAMENNVYLITAKSSGEQILIDAANEPDKIRNLLREATLDSPERIQLKLIITTHQHRDHVQALSAIADPGQVLTAAGSEDMAAISKLTGVQIDRGLNHGDFVGVRGIWLSVIGLRGHTPGSVALAYAEPGQPVRIFSGDSLFPGGVGNTDRDPRRFRSLFRDINERVFDAYHDDTIVLPGHGDFTTLGAERPHLPEWELRGW